MYATKWIVSKEILHFKLKLVFELLFIIFSPLGRFGYKYDTWSFSPLPKSRTWKYETKNALIRDPSMTIFVYFVKIMLAGGGLHSKCLQGFMVFPAISIEKGCKNHKETLYSSKGKIVYVVGKPCNTYRLQGNPIIIIGFSPVFSFWHFNKYCFLTWLFFRAYLSF